MKFRISFTLEHLFLRTGKVGDSADLFLTFDVLGKHLAAAAFLPWQFYGISQLSVTSIGREKYTWKIQKQCKHKGIKPFHTYSSYWITNTFQ